MRLPPELMDKIFAEGESNPRNVRSFGKMMSTKTKQKNLNCKKVIDTGDVKKVRLLKFQNSKCTYSDLIYSLEKGFIDIAKYINSAYPEAQITYINITMNIVENNADLVDKLMQIYRFENMEDYYSLFGIIRPDQKKIMKIVLNRRPYKNKPIVLSKLFDEDLNFLMMSLDDYFKNFMSVADNIIIDDNFMNKLLQNNDFRNLDILFKYKYPDIF
jgi:hypothetical protein